LVDTAGWETARDGIEEAAAHLRQEQLNRADLVLWCSAIDRTAEEVEQDDSLFSQCRSLKSRLIRITTKLDLAESLNKPRTPEIRQTPAVSVAASVAVSVNRQEGIDHLKRDIIEHLTDLRTGQEMIGTTAARCEESLTHAVQGLIRARQLVNDAEGDELIALELRDVLSHLGRIVGEVQDEDILDRIFSRFCIGK
ncbi:MAG TPA: hypothetical protein VNQ76_14740, partial [Planctomicrobium sp.]|nr:hypothetical protein [Planctomicrobium sp.]